MKSQLLVFAVAVFVGHGGAPLDGNRIEQRDAGPATGSAADADASRFLAAARGADPVICSLAAAPLGDSWGGRDRPPAVRGAEPALVEWALKPSVEERDLTVLDGGLRDADGCVRAMAARLLAAHGEGPRILRHALGDDGADTRRVAAEGLGYAEDPTAVAALIRLMEDDGDAGVRAAAAWSLGRIEDPSAEDALGRALRDATPEVRLAAIHALGSLELESSIDLLLPMLSDQDSRARSAAAHALGDLH